MRIYSIFDLVAEEYGPVFETKNDAVAVRNFNGLMQANKLETRHHSLYCMGEKADVISGAKPVDVKALNDLFFDEAENGK